MSQAKSMFALRRGTTHRSVRGVPKQGFRALFATSMMACLAGYGGVGSAYAGTPVVVGELPRGGFLARDGASRTGPASMRVSVETAAVEAQAIVSVLRKPAIDLSGKTTVMIDEQVANLLTSALPGQNVYFGSLLGKPLGEIVKSCPRSLKGKVFKSVLAFSGVMEGKVTVTYPPFRGVPDECRYDLMYAGPFTIPSTSELGGFKLRIIDSLAGFRASGSSAVSEFSVVAPDD